MDGGCLLRSGGVRVMGELFDPLSEEMQNRKS